jgi:flagellar biosynthesis/type III secretory pathway protein FliH
MVRFLLNIHALVYHEREQSEGQELQELIEESAQTEGHRREIRTMQQTYAELLKAKGREEGREEGELLARRENLLRLLRRRFHKVPAKVEAMVNKTDDVGQLNAWFDRAATADTLAEVGIVA